MKNRIRCLLKDKKMPAQAGIFFFARGKSHE